MLVSIIIPTLNEELCIVGTLNAVRSLRSFHEVIVADGGSSDRTVEIARSASVRIIHSTPGRGRQQAAGAQAASGEVLWFLHADSVPAPNALEVIAETLSDRRVAGGNFTLHFDGGTRASNRLSMIYPYLRFLGLRYGDSGIFVRRDVYQAVGGFRPYALFEDVDLVSRIRKRGKFQTVQCPLVTSSRRFANRRFTAMFAHWTVLQMLYWLGVHPDRLARMYSAVREQTRE